MIALRRTTQLLFTLYIIVITIDGYNTQGQAQQDYGTNIQALKDDFKALDKNDDGFVDAHELRSSIPGIFEDDITSFFDRYDTDRDGVISLEEYLMVIHNTPQDGKQQAATESQ